MGVETRGKHGSTTATSGKRTLPLSKAQGFRTGKVEDKPHVEEAEQILVLRFRASASSLNTFTF